MCVTVCEDSHPTNLSAFVDVQSKHQLHIGVGGVRLLKSTLPPAFSH